MNSQFRTNLPGALLTEDFAESLIEARAVDYYMAASEPVM